MSDLAVVRDDAGVFALASEWEALWRRAAGAMPFSAPGWLLPWWRAFGNGWPVVATVRDGGMLRGLLALYRLDNKLLPMGVGISDYCDLLLDPAAPPDAAARLLAAAVDAGNAARCDLPDLAPGAHLLEATQPAGWHASSFDGPPCPVLALLPAPAIPSGMRRDVRQARHRADRAGPWSVRDANAAEVPDALADLVRLHGARWRGRGEAGVLADPAVLAFHRDATAGLVASGLLRLAVLRFGDEVAGVVHALVDRSARIFFYLGGFDPDHAFRSPGTLLIAFLLDQAGSEGCGEAHFLRGAERYKYAWGAVDRRNRGRSLVRA